MKLWQQIVNQRINQAMKLTGLPRNQAKGLVGLFYNTHILGDWVPGNTVTEPLVLPEVIKKDIIKNLHRLFGNNSQFVADIADDIGRIVATNKGEYADKLLRLLYRAPIGKKMIETYGRQLASKNITYSSGVMLRIAKRLASMNPDKAGRNLINEIFSPVRKKTFTKGSIKNIKDIDMRKGVLQKIKVGNQVGFALSVPMKLGLETGILTFVFVEGETIYHFIKCNISEDDFFAETAKNLIASSATGASVYVYAAIVATPEGWAILAISAGAYIITDIALNSIVRYVDGPHFSLDDYIGKLPTSIQRRKTTWTILDKKGFFDSPTGRGAFDMPKKKGFFDPPTKKSIWDDMD